MIPYREPGEVDEHLVEVLPPHAERFSNGAIIFRVPSVEVCQPPGAWSRFWHNFGVGAFWECPICGHVYKLCPPYGETSNRWLSLDVEETKLFKERWKR
jgi:hypothetical protein